VKPSPPIKVEPLIEKPIVAAPEVKPSPKTAEPIIEPTVARPKWIDDEEDEEEDLPEGVNLSGGIRGWLSRHFSASRRKS
jgi:hypothetical protein